MEKEKIRKQKLISLIEKQKESEFVDFKQEFYHKEATQDLIKDVISFANAQSNEEKYIIFGVADTYELLDIDYEKIRDISELNQVFKEYCEPFINVENLLIIFAEDYNNSSPMKKVVVPNYQSKSGCAFTYEEEKTLVNHCLANLKKDTSHAFLVLLYAGLRRSELASLKIIDGTWLECETSKERMGKNVVKRKVPFTPMMKRMLPYIDFKKAKNVNLNTLQTTMKRLFPDHHSHELRHTFISRCKESGVSGEVVSIWAGHSLTGTITTTVYTHYSDEFYLKEAEKVDYLQLDFNT